MFVLPTKKFKYLLFVSITNMDELKYQIKVLLNSSNLVYDSKDYTSATILFFKSLFVILDYLLLKKTGKSPKDHSERFRMLKKNIPRLYTFLDKYFPLYRQTYSITIEKEKCDKIKENVEKLIEEYKILE